MNEVVRIYIGGVKKDDEYHYMKSNGYIGADVSQNIAEILLKEQKSGFVLTLVFFDNVKKIDILFISYLMLFKKKHEIKTIIIKAPYLIENVKQTLYQYQFYGSITFKEILFFIDDEPKDEISFIDSEFQFTLKNFTVSASFGPILYLPTIDVLKFISTTQIRDINNNKLIIDENSYIDQSCNKNLSIYSITDYDKAYENFISWMVNKFKNKIFSRDNFTTGKNIGKMDFEEFCNIPIDNLTIIQFIIFYQLVFNFITTKGKFKIRDGLILKKLFVDAIEISKGIEELAKNSVQHSQGKFGIISFRSFKHEEFLELNNFDTFKTNLLESFFPDSAVLSEKIDRYMDINVMDLSEIGIIPTFQNNNQTNKNNKEKKYNENVGDVTLVDLFSINKGIPLIYQAKRANAHLGLLIYTNKIHTYNGYISVQSTNVKPEQCIVCGNDTQLNSFDANIPGTRVQTVIPIREIAGSREEVKNIYKSPIDNSVHFGEIEKILDYNFLEFNATKAFSDIDLVYLKIEEEISSGHALFKLMPKLNSSISNFILLFDDNTLGKMDESELFRFLGEWQINYPKINLSLVNIPVGKVHELFEVNELYSNNLDDLPYWNSHRLTSFYSYFFDEEYNRKFYFTDHFYGNSRNEFMSLNYLNEQTNFSSLMIDVKFKEVVSDRIKKVAKKILPLELKIIVDGKTIFEYNAEYLLQKEISKGGYE